MQRTAIVLDGHLKSALSIVRSLGMHEVSVHCGAERGTTIACHSRYVTERFVYPSPKDNQRDFIDAIKEQTKLIEGKPIVYACSDATVCTLFKFRDELKSEVELLFPDEQAFEIAFDKAATHSEARVHGVPAIKTFLRERKEEIEQLGKEFSFPAVVKTRHSVAWKNGRGVSGTANFVMNEKELLEKFLSLFEATGEPPLVQPFMRGEEYGVSLLVKDGHVYAEVIHHRLRSMSPTGGASVLKETVEVTELTTKMRQYAYTMAQALSWSGPMMVEFKVDSDTREPKLMEINGRWVGSLPLAIAAGVDFPYLYFQMVTGSDLPEAVVSARPYVTTRHFLGDVRHLLRVWFSHDPMRKRLYPRRMKALKDFFKNPKGTKGDVWRWSDPKPAPWEYIDAINRFVGK